MCKAVELPLPIFLYLLVKRYRNTSSQTSQLYVIVFDVVVPSFHVPQPLRRAVLSIMFAAAAAVDLFFFSSLFSYFSCVLNIPMCFLLQLHNVVSVYLSKLKCERQKKKWAAPSQSSKIFSFCLLVSFCMFIHRYIIIIWPISATRAVCVVYFGCANPVFHGSDWHWIINAQFTI